MVEGLRRPPTLQFAQQCDQAFGTPGTFVRLQRFTRTTPLPAWFQPWAEIEATAAQLRLFEHSMVPGLLQTPDYARALLSVGVGGADAEIDQEVTARIERQAVLDRANPPLLWVMMDEGVLRRPVGGREVMRGQIEHLTEAAAQPGLRAEALPRGASADLMKEVAKTWT
jgi:hypothetical protein